MEKKQQERKSAEDELLVRLVREEDFVELSEWFSKRKWPVPPGPDILPKTGYVAVKGDEMLSVAWLYPTTTPVAFVDWMATNPESGTLGLRSLVKVLDHIKRISDPHVSRLMFLTPNDKLTKFAEKRMKFKKTEKANILIWSRGSK